MRIGSKKLALISLILFILNNVLCVITGFGLLPYSSILFPIFLSLDLIVCSVTFFILAKYIYDSKTKNLLNEENIRNFGSAKDFYSYYVFAHRVQYQIMHLKKGEEAYVVRFSSFSNTQTISSYASSVVKFNGYVADFLISYFSKSKNRIKKEVSFCYYHDTFIIYIKDNVNGLNKVINDIDNELYKINQEHDLKLFIQPYYGVVLAEKKKNTVIDLIAKSSVARKVAQINFQEVVFYEKTMEKEDDTVLANSINEAIENNEFVVYYQPKFNLVLNKFISSEALVRWDNPKRGLLSPSQFVPQAEQMGMIHKIDMYIFERVCKDLQDCKKKGRRLLL